MVIKKCLVNLNREEIMGDYTRVVDGDIEIYEKTEGEYTEIVAKILGITDVFKLASSGDVVNSDYINDENFVIYPNCTLEEFLSMKNSYNADVTYKD